MSERPRIPSAVDIGIRLLNGHRCCVCYQPDIQIHHIDGDHSNNDPANLAVLCLVHHDQAEQAKAKGGQRLSRKLDAPFIREAKSRREDAQARLLGAANANAFRKNYLGPQSVSEGNPEFEAIAFRDIAGWLRMHNRVAAYLGPSGHNYAWPVRKIDGELWCIVAPASPGSEKRANWEGWVDCGSEKVIPLSRQTKESFALTTFDHLPAEKQARHHSMTLDRLEYRRALSDIGVYCTFTVNGPQEWPTDDQRAMQIAVWAQHICVLGKYFQLLGSQASSWSSACGRFQLLRATNRPCDQWDVSPWDGGILERVEWLVPFIQGKAQTLRSCVEEQIRRLLKMGLDEVTEHLTVPRTESVDPAFDWALFCSALRISIAALSSPEEAQAAVLYANPILQVADFQSYCESGYKQKLVVDNACLWGQTKHISPGEQPGACKLRMEFQNHIVLSLTPDTRPVDPKAYAEAISVTKIEDLLSNFRGGSSCQ